VAERRAGWSTGQTKSTPVPFDDETLGGYVDYSAISELTHYLEGELKWLTIATISHNLHFRLRLVWFILALELLPRGAAPSVVLLAFNFRAHRLFNPYAVTRVL